jgi:hypothetical protein
MMSTRGSAPASPVLDPPGSSALSPAGACTEALFKEAKRRRRRRRLAAAGAILALAALAIAFGVTRAPRLPGPGGPRTGQAGGGPGTGVAPGTSVAWVDYNGRLHIGDLTAGTQHVVATINANPAMPLTQVGGRIYWLDQASTFVPALGHRSEVIREIDLASGRIRVVGPGQSVFPAADGRHVFVSRTDTSLLEVPVGGTAPPRLLRLPPGWFVPYGQSIGVGNGILAQSADRGRITRGSTTGVWNPGSRRVRETGRDRNIELASPPGAGATLLAWVPLSCAPGQDCRLRITSAQTLSTRTVRSPLRHGFAAGGAFSPGGRRLAVFANLTGDPHAAVLALIDTRTGSLRLVPSARTDMGAPLIWARWLPDGRHLIAGGIDSGYLVDASTMTARPLAFMKGPAHDGEDVDYSTVVIPPRR